jgi:23S rRNA pseudouridine1911/1915/1917 synthase
VYDQSVQGAKEAVLHYTILASSDNYHLLDIQLETGRHHQIRAQLAAIGCFVKGDVKYGAKRPNKDGSIGLHARKLAFSHPVTSEKIIINAPVPEDALWKYFEQ